MRYKVTVSYDGSKFIGWQKQITGLSVQEDIERVLTLMHKQTIKITGSGRTDKGVHGIAQVFHFDSDLKIEVDKLCHALNCMTHPAIYIVSIQPASPTFHARFDVKQKVYEYRINLGPYDVFMKDYHYQLNHSLDIELMKQAAKIFVGTHDFTSFNSNSLTETPDQVRTIFSIEFQQTENCLSIVFTGNGFLRYMVRMLTQALIDVGEHKISCEVVSEWLEAKNKEVVTGKAPAQGLYLKEVIY